MNYSTFIAASARAHFGNVNSLTGSHSKMFHLACLWLGTTSMQTKKIFLSDKPKKLLLIFMHECHAAWAQDLMARGVCQLRCKQSWRVNIVCVWEDPHGSSGNLRSNCFIRFLFAFSSCAVYTKIPSSVLQHVCFPHYFLLLPTSVNQQRLVQK